MRPASSRLAAVIKTTIGSEGLSLIGRNFLKSRSGRPSDLSGGGPTRNKLFLCGHYRRLNILLILSHPHPRHPPRWNRLAAKCHRQRKTRKALWHDPGRVHQPAPERRATSLKTRARIDLT